MKNSQFLRAFVEFSSRSKIPSRIGSGSMSQLGVINPMAHVYTHIGPFTQHLKQAQLVVTNNAPLKDGTKGLPKNYMDMGYLVAGKPTPDGVRFRQVPVYWPREYIAAQKDDDSMSETLDVFTQAVAESPELAREILRLNKVWK